MKFTKMHGLGNDFIVIDGIDQKFTLTSAQIVALAKRDTGIGFDQCLLIEKSNDKKVDFCYRIFNADGTEVGQCGNGARCLARFLQHYGLTNKKLVTVATPTTTMQLQINDNDTVTIMMECPKLQPKEIPFIAEKQQKEYALPLENGTYCALQTINVGNPHAILVVDDVLNMDINLLGRQISQHNYFPEQTNVGFMEILNEHHIRLRVYERGCGETQACGSGAVAAAAIGHLFHHLNAEVTVSLLGGDLLVNWPDSKKSISLTGPATFVYEGTLLN